jgi:hypothetical protein
MLHLVLSVLIYFTISNAHGYTYISSRFSFPSDKIVINVTNDDCSNAGITSSAQLLGIAYGAINRFWNRVPTSSLELSQGSVTSISSNGDTSTSALAVKGSPNSITVGCNDDVAGFSNASDGILAVGGIICNGNGCFGGIIINAHANSTVDDQSSDVLETILAHEVGHSLGLGHSEKTYALMHYTISGKVQKKLSQDDIDGISSLYPQDKQLAGLLGSCGIIEESGPPNSNNILWAMLLAFMLTIIFLEWMKSWRGRRE